MCKTFTEIIFITENKRCKCKVKCKHSFNCKYNYNLNRCVLLEQFWSKLQNKFNTLPENIQILEAIKFVN